jgi:outer membrane receptor protein involved in Fe transport
MSSIATDSTARARLRTDLKRHASTVSLAALVASFAPYAIGAAHAQGATPGAGAPEQIDVSATRIVRDGFQAPTPTTVVSSDDIIANAQQNIYATISQLPSMMGGEGVQNNTGGTGGGFNGLSSFSMRGLQPIRTLTLIDGQRIVPANVTGIADVSLLPQLLIQRVDVVTGGASASWGSDAVAGVVNFVTDKHFVGFKANIQGGVSTYGDDAGGLIQAAAGTDFAGGKGHIEASAEYDYEAGVPSGSLGEIGAGASGRNWYSSTALLKNSIAATPAGQPQYFAAAHANDFQLGKYSIITTGPLQGTTFGANGVPTQYNYGFGPNGLPGVPTGNAVGTVTNCISPWCIGGDNSGAIAAGVTNVSPISRINTYARVSYDLTPNINIWATVNYGKVNTENNSVINIPIFGGLNINCGNAAGGPNAFLPASINQQCVADNITKFQIGTDNGAVPSGATIRTDRTQRRFVVGADGSFGLMGTDWTWNSSFEYGVTNAYIHVHTFLNPYFNAAVDSVQVTAANQATYAALNVPLGNIVCRSVVADQEGCQPYNVFGNAPVPAATINWLYGGNHLHTSQNTHLLEDSFSFSVNGNPLSTWAGPVTVASGFEFRNEGYNVTGDPVSTGGPACTDPLLNCATGGNWFNGNFFSGTGAYHVYEGFLETVVPLLKDANWGEIDVDLGGRATGYSTSGYVNTWKVGATWDTPIDGLRLRALQSRDIRAPNLSELFAAQTVTTGTVINDFTTQPFSIQNISRGNTTLKPEKAQTTEVGIVFQPSWFPGFSQSVDYYRVGIKGQISSFSSQQIMDLCFNGFTAECSSIITSPANGSLSSPSTSITQVIATAFNLASTVTDGFDFETSYHFTMNDWGIPGDVTLRSLVTHVSKFISTSGVLGTVPHESAGENGGAIPHWKLYESQTYNTDKWSISLIENYISDGRLNTQYIQCTTGCPLPTVNNPTVNNNVIPGAFYLNVGGTYNIDDHWQAFFKVDNVLNHNPPAIPNAAPNTDNGVNPVIYDVIGRMYRLGVRLDL